MDPCIAYSKTSTLHRPKFTPADPDIACTCKAYVVEVYKLSFTSFHFILFYDTSNDDRRPNWAGFVFLIAANKLSIALC